jgi:hypothetical protein
VKLGRGIAIICMAVMLLGGTFSTGQAPLFFTLEYPDHHYKSEKVGEYDEEGLMEPLVIDLVQVDGLPAFYSSRIRTTVCDDEVCEIMHIRLFWDLTGEYAGYDTLDGHPLTKFDHEPFISEDYAKLHELLSNDGSILKFKTKEELIDKAKVKASDVVDGTTGATAVEIREEVVEGALYTSYTIWHIAYKGAIKNMLNHQTAEVYDEGLKERFLSSDRSAYQLFALDRFTEQDFKERKDFLLRSLKDGIPLLRKMILNDLPDPVWREEEIQSEICSMFDLLDVNSKTLLLGKIKNTDMLHSSSLLLSREVRKMNKNQLLTYLDVLNEQSEWSALTLSHLKSASEDPKFQYNFLVEERLSEKVSP